MRNTITVIVAVCLACSHGLLAQSVADRKAAEGIAVGDISGKGISAALLMATPLSTRFFTYKRCFWTPPPI